MRNAATAKAKLGWANAAHKQPRAKTTKAAALDDFFSSAEHPTIKLAAVGGSKDSERAFGNSGQDSSKNHGYELNDTEMIDPARTMPLLGRNNTDIRKQTPNGKTTEATTKLTALAETATVATPESTAIAHKRCQAAG